MELTFVFAVISIQIFPLHFFKIVEIVRAFGIDTVVYAEELAIFLGNKSISAVRTYQPEWSGDVFAGADGLSAYFALVLAIVTLNRLNRFVILPLIVFEKELPVLFDKGFDDREFIHFKFLILWRMKIIKSPLFERDISANKI